MMYFDFWFDLPKALSNIVQEHLTKDELEYSNILASSCESFNKILNQFKTNVNEVDLNTSDLYLRDKLAGIQREQIELMCRSIKFSTKLMIKILNLVENFREFNIHESDLLMKIKLFFKISRLILENTQTELMRNTQGKENEFFQMIRIFTEKVQCKLYSISNGVINSIQIAKNTNENAVR